MSMLALLLLVVPALAPQAPPDPTPLQGADAGLEFLVRTQCEDGGWPDPPMRAHDRIVDTAFAGLALVAAGERMDRGRFHPALRDAVRFLQERLPPRGPMGVDRPRPGPWQHMETWYAAITMLLLAEVHAATPDPELAESLRRLHVRLAFLQKTDGGWCHDLSPRVREVRGLGRAEYSEDLAAAGCFVLAALTASARAGVPGAEDVHRRGTDWLLRLCNDDGGVAYGLQHTWPQAVRSEPGRTAAALWAMLPQWGRGHSRAIAAARYLDARFRELPNSEGHGGKEFLVSHLAGAMACRVWGDEAARRHAAVFAPMLLRRQHRDGHFVLGNGAWDTPANNTAIAVLCLLAPAAPLLCAARAAPAADAAARGGQRLGAMLRADGSCEGRWGGRHMDLCLTALAVQAMLAEDPLGGRERARASLQWLCAEVGLLVARDFVDGARSHLGFQLPEVVRALVSVGDDAVCRQAASAVVAELVRSQRQDGGFGYDFGELYTLCVATSGVVLALVDARDAGLAVDDAAIERGLDYLQACQGDAGGFRYCPDPSHAILARDRARYLREEMARTFGALAALVRGGRGDGAVVQRGLAFVQREWGDGLLPRDDRYLWFSLLQGQVLRPTLPASLRQRWDALVDARLHELQRPDGAFCWPGMQWSEALGRPAMHEPFATAAGTLLAAWRRSETP